MSEARSNASLPVEKISRGHIPGLDGLRALAIAGVFIFHVFPESLTGGYVGVDVFFVLSGFLITAILQKDLQGNPSARGFFLEFYLRRIQRLLPNAVLAIAATIIVAALFLPPECANFSGRHGLFSLIALPNFFARTHLGDYWGVAADGAPFIHYWSLGVEEQFYLFFPLLLWFGFSLKRFFVPFLALLILASFLCSVWLTAHNQASAFYLPHTRFWELLAGGVLALVTRPFDGLVAGRRTVSGVAGLVLIIGSYFFIPRWAPFPGWIAALPVIGSALVLFSLRAKHSFLLRALQARPLAAIGKVSYSLYLWHWPAIVLTSILWTYAHGSERTGAVAGGILGIILGVAAYYFVECPLRRRRKGRERRLAIIAGMFITTFSLCYYFGEIKPFPKEANVLGKIDWFGDLYVTDKFNAGAWDERRFPPRPTAFLTPDRAALVRPSAKSNSQTPEVVLAGSSHALMYARVLDDVCVAKDIPIAFLCRYGTSPFGSNKIGNDLRADILKWSRTWKSKLLIIADPIAICEPDALCASVQELLDATRETGLKIAIVAQVPTLEIGDRVSFLDSMRFFHRRDGKFPSVFPCYREQKRRRVTAALEELAKRESRFLVVRPDALFLNADGSVRYLENGKFLYGDDDHLCDAGAELTRPLFDKLLDTTLPSQSPAAQHPPQNQRHNPQPAPAP